MGLFQLPFVVEGLARWPGGPIDQGLRRSGMTARGGRFRTEIVEYGALPHALGWYRALPLSRGRGMAGRSPSVPPPWCGATAGHRDRAPGVDGRAEYVDAPYDLVVLRRRQPLDPTHAPDALADAILARAAG